MVQNLTSRCLTRTIITDNSCKPQKQYCQKSMWPNKVPEITKSFYTALIKKHIKCDNWNAYSRYLAAHIPVHIWKLYLGKLIPIMTVTASKRKVQMCPRTRKCSKENCCSLRYQITINHNRKSSRSQKWSGHMCFIYTCSYICLISSWCVYNWSIWPL